MRRLAPLLLLLGLAATPVQEKPKPPELNRTVTSKHYECKTNAEEDQARELLEYMELVHATYMALLKPLDPVMADKSRNVIRLYKDRNDFLASGAPKGAGAYYSLQSKELVGYYDPITVKPFFAHEGMHQFTDLTSKNFRDFPMWFSEGIADCIGNNEVRAKKLYMCLKGGTIARMRLPIIQEALKAGKAYRLADLFRLNQMQFMQNAGLCYAQSWSFCHFLITYPDLEERDHQVPSGKFRKNLAIYYERIRAGGSSHEAAWNEAFAGLPLEQIEELWKKYVMKFDPAKTLGFAGQEVTDEEWPPLKLPKEKSGVKVVKVAPDGVGAKGGLKEGDIIIGFDGRLLPRDEALPRLISFMQEVSWDRQTKLRVRRGEEDVELLVRWDAPKKSP